VSPETAYTVEDYPYGFRLRCQIRYWLEYKKGHGYRLVSQTSNPKRPGLVWNKPKASTYGTLGVMFLDHNEHVQWETLHPYATEDELDAFVTTYGEALQGHQERNLINVLRAVAQAYEARKAQREDRSPLKSLLLALTFAAAVACFTAGPAWATCTKEILYVNGTMYICTKCCTFISCSVDCV